MRWMLAWICGSLPTEIGILYETPLAISDLRWLVAKGFAEHGQETPFLR